MEKTKKDQFVIAYLPNLDHYDTVLAHAKALSQMLNKGLILLHICDSKYSSLSTEQAEVKLKSLITSSHESYCAINGKTKEIIEELPTLLNGVVVVAEVNPSSKQKSPSNPKTVIKNFATCKIAWLTVQPNIQPNYQQIAITVDFHRESKEKYVWASYFARFNKSLIHVLYQEYKDNGLHMKWYNNMRFLHKLYTNLEITFSPHPIQGDSASVDKDALPFMKQHNINLLVTVTTKEKDVFDQLFGAAENRIIKNSQQIPILFLNPREDIYVLCD